MPRWLEVTVTLALFTAVMLAVGWVLKLVVPGVLAPFGAAFGWPAVVVALAALAVAGLAFSLWPRDEAGRMRPILPRRR